MGTCYSCQARISKPTYPSDMSLNSNTSSKKGSQRVTSNAFINKDKSSRLRPPSSSGSASPRQTSALTVDKLNSSGESGIVLTVENTQTKYKRVQNGNQRKSETNSTGPRRTKFGFQSKSSPRSTTGRSDANRNLMDVSSDSLDSIDSKHSSHSSSSLLRKKNLNSPRSYCPKEGARWKMIDDSESTTTDSKSISTQGRSEHEGERDRNGNALTPTPQFRNPSKPLSGSLGKGAGMNPGGSKLPSRLRQPQTKQTERQWVKAGPVEMEEHKAANVDRQKTPTDSPAPTETSGGAKKRRGFFTRGRGRLQFGGERTSSEESKQKYITQDSGLGDTLVQDEISKTVESMFRSSPEAKDVKETINVLSKDIASVTVSDNVDKDSLDGVDVGNRQSEQLGQEQTEQLSKDDLEPVSRPRLDSLETCSLGSFNSDDLMLETDLLDDPYNQSTCSLDKSFAAAAKPQTLIRSGSTGVDPLSMSQPASGLAKLDKRPFGGRNMGGGYWRQGSVKGDGARERRLRTQSSTNEAVAELSSMIGSGGSGVAGAPPAIQRDYIFPISPISDILRRPPKFSRERPASFPGPLSAEPGSSAAVPTGRTADRPIQFRQRGKAPSISDEEQVLVDAGTFRTLMQELTDCKTMIFKLKRVIQQEEIGSPFGNHTFAGTLKNGYKLSASGSAPGSPMVSVDGAPSFGFTDKAPDSNVTEVMQENTELRQQLQTMQRQLDEQDRTIKLLQQQMTKYECGHYGAEGKVFNTATTQTDKPRLAVPKNVLRPSQSAGSHGHAGAAGAGGEPVISSRRLSNPKEDQDGAASGDKPARPKSQLPVGSIRAPRNSTSRLPAMRIQRISKGQPQLQSFSKLAQAQQAN